MQNKTKNILHVYDFDDTLISTTAVVYIRNKNTGETKQIIAHKFYEYTLEPDEEFDLSEFEDLPNPKLLPLFSEFIEDINTLGESSVAILTARYNPEPIQRFLASHNITGIEIVAVGLADPKPGDKEVAAQRKKDWIRSQIIDRSLDFLLYFDDCEENIELAKELIEEFPHVTFLIELVD